MAKLATAAAFCLVLLVGALYSLEARMTTAAPDPIAAYFQQGLSSRGAEGIGGMPIEGFTAELLMQSFPQLKAQDFDGVETFEGINHYVDGKLRFERTASPDAISTAERTVSAPGYATLLKHVAERLGLPARTEADVDAILAVVAPQQKSTTKSAKAGSATLEARIGQSVSALDVTITPKAVIEDSRCPADVQCIWAGRVRITVTLTSGLGTSDQEFTLGQTITTEAETVTLVEVTPAMKSNTDITPAQYRFIFEVKKRSDS